MKPEASDGLDDGYIEALIEQRKEGRKNENFAESDRILDGLKEQGIILVDQAREVTTWHRS